MLAQAETCQNEKSFRVLKLLWGEIRVSVSQLQTQVILMKKVVCLRGFPEAGLENAGELFQEAELAAPAQWILELLWITDCSVPSGHSPLLNASVYL